MNEFDDIFQKSTREIENCFFQLPVAGQEDPIYRERVYCYELYHQFRTRWPEGCVYSLSGEVDKLNHPLIRGNGLDKKKPDMLIHVPGEMGRNYLVLEVKPITGYKDQLKKDLETLTAFRRHGNYHRAILLIYGKSNGTFNEIHQNLNSIIEKDSETNLIQKDLIEIWHHHEAGVSATKKEW